MNASPNQYLPILASVVTVRFLRRKAYLYWSRQLHSPPQTHVPLYRSINDKMSGNRDSVTSYEGPANEQELAASITEKELEQLKSSGESARAARQKKKQALEEAQDDDAEKAEEAETKGK